MATGRWTLDERVELLFVGGLALFLDDSEALGLCDTLRPGRA